MGRPWPQAVGITRYGCGTCANRRRRLPCCAGTRIAVYSVAFSPDGQTLASGSGDNTSTAVGPAPTGGGAYRAARARELRSSPWPSVRMGRLLASGSADNTIRLWDLRQPTAGTYACCAGTRMRSTPWPSVQMGRPWPQAVRITRYGCGTCANRRRPLPCCAGTKIGSTPWPSVRMGRPWPQAVGITRYGCGTCANRRRPLPCCAGTRIWVFSVAFSPDGQTLASGSGDQTIRIWIARTEILAGKICQQVWRNLTLDEWRQFVGADLPYERTCPNLLAGEGVPAEVPGTTP